MQSQDYFGHLGLESCQGGLTLVQGSLQLPGLFILQQYLRLFLQRDYAVILVAAEQSAEHYKYVAKKTGLNLQPHLHSGHLTLLEPPLATLLPGPGAVPPVGSAPCSGAHGKGDRGAGSDAVSSGSAGCSAASGGSGARGGAAGGSGGGSGGGEGGGLRRLFADVCAAVERRPAGAAGVAVLVDSLTVLAGLCPSREEWAAFLHHCCCSPALGGGGGGGGGAARPGATTSAEHTECCGAAQSGVQVRDPRDASSPSQGEPRQVPYCVVAGVYDDVPDDRLWLASLEHRANVVVAVEPLPGRIADVDGMVTVTRRCLPHAVVRAPAADTGAAAAAAAAPLRQSLYFRSTELAIRWMPTVTARELL